jgi:hypothetical protein
MAMDYLSGINIDCSGIDAFKHWNRAHILRVLVLA